MCDYQENIDAARNLRWQVGDIIRWDREGLGDHIYIVGEDHFINITNPLFPTRVNVNPFGPSYNGRASVATVITPRV